MLDSSSKASSVISEKDGPTLEKKDNKGDSPLHIAARKGNTEVIKMLLLLGISIDEENECGERPLYLAVTSGQEEAVRCLLEAGADIETTTAQGCSVWHAAASAGNADILKLLHDWKIRARSTKSDKSPEDSVVSTDKGSAKAKSIATKTVSSTKGGGPTNMEQADASKLVECKAQKTSKSRKLKGNANKKTVSDKGGSGCEQIYSKTEHLSFSSDSENESNDIVKTYIIPTFERMTILNVREFDGDKVKNDLKKLLSTHLGRNFILNSKSENGNTPLHVGAASGSDKALEWFLKKRPGDINALAKMGETPLHVAASHGTARMIELLIKAGAKYDTVDNAGDTVLHRAAGGKNLQTLKKLLSMGLDPNVKNNTGSTPLHFACSQTNTNEIIKELLQHGASLSEPDNNGITSLMVLHATGSKFH